MRPDSPNPQGLPVTLTNCAAAVLDLGLSPKAWSSVRQLEKLKPNFNNFCDNRQLFPWKIYRNNVRFPQNAHAPFSLRARSRIPGGIGAQFRNSHLEQVTV